MTSSKVEEAISMYAKVREKRSDLKRRYEEKDLELKNALDKIEAFLSKYLSEQKLQSCNIGLYTAYFAKEYKVGCADWPNFWEWLAQQKRFDLLEKRVAVGGVKTYLEDKGELPPFVNLSVEKVVRVRRA